MLEDLFKIVRKRLNDSEKSEKPEKPEKLKEKSKGAEIPRDLLFKCPRCRAVTYREELEKVLKVCPNCNYHSRLAWNERLEMIADENTFVEYDANMRSLNPLEFPDYENKIKTGSETSGLKDAIVTGECLIRGYRAVIGIMDSRFMMASMGSVVGEKITRALERAAEKKLPAVLFTASGGARMQEGIISLMQMAKTSGATAKLSEAGQLYITVMTDPTTGGVTASFASLGDVIIAEPLALIGFAGRRVIQDTIKQQLPDDFQTAEFLTQCGFVDMITERRKMRSTLAKIIKLHNYLQERTAI